MLRIGVDATMLNEQPAGIGRYLAELLVRMIPCKHQWVLYSHRPLTDVRWKHDNVVIRHWNMPKRMFRFPWVQTVIPALAKNDDLDIFWSPAHRLPVMLPARIAEVVTVHDLVWRHAPETMRPLSRWLDASMMPMAVRSADRVISVSESTTRDLLAEMPFAADKVRTIPLGSPSFTSLATDTKFLDKVGIARSYVLFVGTMEPRKNLAGLIEAFSRLPCNLQKQASIVIVGGGGWGSVDALSIAARFGVSERVKVLGYVSDEQLAALYGHADFLAMPSFYEGFGLPVLEAMSYGIPVLTSNCSSMPEVAGDAAVYVDPHDISSIAQGLQVMLGDRAYRARLVARTNSNLKRFSWARAAEQTLNVFEEAVQAKRTKLPKGR